MFRGGGGDLCKYRERVGSGLENVIFRVYHEDVAEEVT